MKERERAHRLARAIEDLLQGHPPADLDDEDLNELLQIANIRLDAARSSSHAGAQHEGTVWQQVLARLARLQGTETGEPNGIANLLENAEDPAATEDPAEFDIKELQDIIALRRQMAERTASLAEAHRAPVWQQVQARIQARSQKRGLFSFLRRPQPEAEVLSPAIDQLVLGEPIWEVSDSRLGGLINVARTRRAMGQAAATAASGEIQGRLWARIRPRLLARLLSPQQQRTRVFRHGGPPWPKLAAAGAAVALLLAALGPIPATGLANHPVLQLVPFRGEHAAVTETTSPPPAPPVIPPATEVVEGLNVTTEEAGKLLGLPARQPTLMPPGFRPVSSQFFPPPLTADEGGTFLLIYSEAAGGETANPPTILIYQEQASGDDIAVQQGSALDFTLADGTAATYIEGSWRPSGNRIVWREDDAQSLVFDRDGLRTIIHYIDGPRIHPSYLLAVAEGMAEADTP